MKTSKGLIYLVSAGMVLAASAMGWAQAPDRVPGERPADRAPEGRPDRAPEGRPDRAPEILSDIVLQGARTTLHNAYKIPLTRRALSRLLAEAMASA